MKRVEPQLQFQGSAQSQGFNAIQAPDVSNLLRQNMQVEQQNLDNYRQAALNNMKLQNLSNLAGFSETLSNTLIEQTKQKNERDIEEGIQLYYMNGVPQDQQDSYDQEVDKLRTAHEGVQKVADVAQKGGAPFEGVQQIRNLSGWKKYGFAMGVAKDAGDNYGGWLAEQLQSNTTTPVTVGEVSFTPASAETPAQKAAATAVLRMEYMRSKGLLGLHPGLLNKHAFPQFREYENRILNKVREDYVKEQQQMLQDETISNFAASTNKKGDFITALADLKRAGVPMDKAREMLLDTIPTVEEFNNTVRDISWDGVKSWEGKYLAQIRDLRTKLMQRLIQKESMQDSAESQERENWTDEALQSFGDQPVSREIAQRFIDTSKKLWKGWVDPRLEKYLTDDTLEARSKQEQDRYLSQLWAKDELTRDEVMSGKYDPEIASRWESRAREQDKMRAPDVKQAREPAANAVTNALKAAAGLMQAGSTPHWSYELAKAHAMRQIDAKAKVYLASKYSADEAYSRAAQDVIQEINNSNPSDKQGFGTYSLDKGADAGKGAFMRWSQFGSGGMGGMASAKADVNAMRVRVNSGGRAAVFDSTKPLIPKSVAESMVNPDSPIHPSIYIIQNALPSGKEMSEFDIIDAQLAAHKLPPRQRPYTQQVVQTRLTPKMQALLNRTPDSFRTRRALTEGGLVGPGQERQAIQYIATELGVDPIDVATFINYETGGRLVNGEYRRGLDTWGGDGGRYLGWIQFSPDNQAKYGVRVGMSPMEMSQAIVKYMKNAGVRPGDSLDMLYQAVQAPANMGQARAKGRNIGADTNGSISSHVARMRKEHSGVASRWLTEGASAQPTNIYRDSRLLSAPARKLLSQWQLTSGFKSQESFRSSPHEGNDYATPTGTKISFKQSGTVLNAVRGTNDRSSNGGYGGYIDVKLADGNIVRIGHLSDVMVTKGMRLRPRQIAALTGNTGRSTGAHSHIEHLSGPTGTQESTRGKRDPSWIASQVYADI
jgi:hypothetical protein